MSEYKGIIDCDFIRYAVACAGEKRSIKVIHKQSGREKEFSNRSEFWGRDRNKSGGWLGELNKQRDSQFSVDEFDIIDLQTPEPIENVLHSAKLMYEGIINKAGVSSAKGFIGKGESFRVDKSTIVKYKDNRKDLIRPIHMQEVTEYLIRKFNLEVVEGLEVDDRVVMECYKQKNKVLVGVDKDYYSCPVIFFNTNRPEEGYVNCDCFGKLYLKDKKVRGYGRQHLYWQVASNDTSDNYAANSACDTRWGDKSAYDILVNCNSDKESLEALKTIYQYLYPEPFEFEGWRGDKIQMDWLYVLQENWDMARMLRFENDDVKIRDVMTKMGIEV